jgi:hypothetical protein
VGLQLTTTAKEIEVIPANGHNFTLEEIRKYCKCKYVEAVFFNDGRAIFFDEDYLFSGPNKPDPKDRNVLATNYIRRNSPNTLIGGGGIYGNALLLTKEEVDNDRDVDLAYEKEDEDEIEGDEMEEEDDEEQPGV